MPDIHIDISKLVENSLIPLVFSFTVGLVFYLTLFNYEWGWPTVIGCGCFLLIQIGLWMKANYEWNKNIEKARQNQQAQDAIIQHRMNLQAQEKKEAAKVFLHDCLEVAVGLYKYPKHSGEKETERYVTFGDYTGYDYAEKIERYVFNPQNQKYNFLYCDNGFSHEPLAPIHVLFDPVFYELVKNYVETGVIDFMNHQGQVL